MSRGETKSATLDVIVPALLSKAQVGKFLGGMSVASVERLHASGALGPLPITLGQRLVRYSRRELELWIAEGCPPRHVWEKRRDQ